MIKRKEKRINNILGTITVLMLVLQKIAIHIGEFEFSIALVFLPLLIFGLKTKRKANINKKRLLVFGLVFGLSFISNIANISTAKYSSFALFIVMYFFLCFDLKLSDINRNIIRNATRTVLKISAIIGILQFFGQLIGIKYFDLLDIIPESLKLSGFNTYYAIAYGSKIMKSNGSFFLEPSFFSQFMALGIVLELTKPQITRSEITAFVLYGLGLICSFSGTGILLLIVAFFPLINRLSIRNRFIIITSTAVAIFLFSRSQYFSAITNRILEFNSSVSSGGIRFVNPYIVAFGSGNSSFLLGTGAGTAGTLNYFFEVNHNAITKVMLEYGLIVLIPFIIYIYKCFTRNCLSVLSLSVLFMYTFLGGNLLQPSIVYPLFLLADAENGATTRLNIRHEKVCKKITKHNV